MRRQTLGWSLCNVGVKPSIHPPVSPITSQHEERWGEVGSPPMWTPSLLVATLSKDSFLLWHGTSGYKPSQRSPWWHYLELTVFSAWALAQILFKKKKKLFHVIYSLCMTWTSVQKASLWSGANRHPRTSISCFSCGWLVHSPVTKESDCLRATDNVWGVII